MICFTRDKSGTKEETYCYCYACRKKICFSKIYYIYNLYGRTFLFCSRECISNFVHEK